MTAPRLLLPTPPRAPLTQVAEALPGALATGLVACVRLDLPGATEPEIRRAAATGALGRAGQAAVRECRHRAAA